ncbi:MAG: hypothetical protein ACYDA9_08940 [Terriglobia bacterium]
MASLTLYPALREPPGWPSGNHGWGILNDSGYHYAETGFDFGDGNDFQRLAGVGVNKKNRRTLQRSRWSRTIRH